MQESTIPASFDRTNKAAAPICVAAIAVFTASALFFRSLYPLALIMSPVIGLLAFAADFLHWRMQKNWLSNWSAILFIALVGVVGYGPFWVAVPQTIALALLFWLGPVVIFKKQLARVAYARHS